jgi:hypothetical protein
MQRRTRKKGCASKPTLGLYRKLKPRLKLKAAFGRLIHCDGEISNTAKYRTLNPCGLGSLRQSWQAGMGYAIAIAIVMPRATSPVPKNKESKLAKKKKVIRRAWSKEDVRTLKMMARDKKGVTKIARALKRTVGATSVMAAKRGVSLSMRG